MKNFVEMVHINFQKLVIFVIFLLILPNVLLAESSKKIPAHAPAAHESHEIRRAIYLKIHSAIGPATVNILKSVLGVADARPI